MRQRRFQLSLIACLTVTLFAILMVVGGLIGPAAASQLTPGESVRQEADSPSVVARRLISIPYTVNTVLPLSADGQLVETSGTGSCAGLGKSFNIQLTVVQNGQQHRARGVTSGDCANQNGWQANAMTPGQRALVPGPAEVCGHARIQGGPNGTLIGDWCVDVTLE